MRSDFKDGALTFYLEGRIDSNNAPDIEKEIMNEVYIGTFGNPLCNLRRFCGSNYFISCYRCLRGYRLGLLFLFQNLF